MLYGILDINLQYRFTIFLHFATKIKKQIGYIIFGNSKCRMERFEAREPQFGHPCCSLNTREWCHVHLLRTVCTFHDGCKQGIDQQILIGNRFHVKLRILSPENCKQSLRVKS